jgi:electron transfer flavoprotein beta subunit
LNVVVCVKRVPDTEARIRVDGSGTTIDSTGVKYDFSPYDAFASEAALRAREAAGAGEVTLVTLGDGSAQETLRKGLAMGADRAVLLGGDVGLDGLATAKTLAAELEGHDAPLFLFGVKAADDDQQQVGPMAATLLGRPCVTGVASFELGDGKVVCHREVEGGSEVIEVDLPAVLCMTKGPNEPRLAALKGIMAAKKKPLEEKDGAVAGSRVKVTSLALPPDRPPGRIVGNGVDAVPELVRLLQEEAKVI